LGVFVSDRHGPNYPIDTLIGGLQHRLAKVCQLLTPACLISAWFH
jgi:hypothetical protein